MGNQAHRLAGACEVTHMSQHVAVLMGGWSAEREISLRSGVACAKALEDEGFRVSSIDVGRDIAEVLGRLKPDVAFNALHGRFGEDGTIQGILEILHIPYTHSGVLASALAMRKDMAKIVMAAAGIKVAPGRTLSRFEAARAHAMAPPYVLKPVAEGSSCGVLIVGEGRSHPPQELLAEDWAYGDLLLAEKFIGGRELTCAVIGKQVLDVIDIRAADGGWYDYHAKYAKGGSIHVLPANLKQNIYHQVQELTLMAHEALGCRGVSRTDLRYDDGPEGTGELVVLEVNTQPGMTETSLVPELAAHAGYSFGELVRWMVEDASCDR
jgi:D-alanine-D-alanine ligase